VKEYRRERRAERKANTLAFKEEKGRQEKILLNTRASFQGVKIL
jgi:protein LTV1